MELLIFSLDESNAIKGLLMTVLHLCLSVYEQ